MVEQRVDPWSSRQAGDLESRKWADTARVQRQTPRVRKPDMRAVEDWSALVVSKRIERARQSEGDPSDLARGHVMSLLDQVLVTAPAQTQVSCWWGGTPKRIWTARGVQATAWATTSSSTPSSQTIQALTRTGSLAVLTLEWVNCSCVSDGRAVGA